ncbi:outer membrane beta-barrel protein [uncultured Microscilla sp.]|uniref:outer membrane beta-barrel protein n=1 Tax=uncultured Microscilla sp. TaxID=432653 RepID=UPI00261F8980|nr:outer membrane beta-barrel protein [uncultured Microscilla sp.]
MKELFDERLSQKIRQTFDKHEEPYNAQGWEMMQQQMKAQKSGKMRALLTSIPAKVAAAAILVLGGVFTYKTLQSDFKGNTPTQQQAGIYAKKHIQQEGFEGVKVLPPSITNKTHGNNRVANVQNNRKKASTNQNTAASKQYGVLPTVTTNAIADKGLIENTEKDKNIYANKIAANNHLTKHSSNSVLLNPDDKAVKFDMHALAMKEASYEAIHPTNRVAMIEQASFREVATNKVAQYNNAAVLPKGKRMKFGVMLSSLVNYSKRGEKDSKVNLGGGVMSEIRLGKRLSVTSGVLLTRQSLNMRQSASLPTIATMQKITTSGTTESRSLGQQRSINMQFVGLDIPVNLQYHLSRNTNRGLYVSVGLSSLAYLEERYTHNTRETISKAYYKGGVGSQLERLETTVIETNSKSQPEALSRFDFAKMLNVSMGMKYMVAKNMQILIEPYIKYPLNSLTKEELRFGSAGINLRCNFGEVRRH